MQQTLVICHESDYELIYNEFKDKPTYTIICIKDNFIKIIKQTYFSEIVVLIKERSFSKKIIASIKQLNNASSVYDIYENCREDDYECQTKSFRFVVNWLRNIYILRKMKKEILDEMMERGF